MSARTTKTVDLTALRDWCDQCEAVAVAQEQLKTEFVSGDRFGYVQFKGRFADKQVLFGELWELSV